MLRPGAFRVVSAPSLDWRWEIVGLDYAPPEPDELIISYAFTDPNLLIEFRDLFLKFQDQDKLPDGSDNGFLAIGADVGGERADHWCPGSATLAMFGDRKEARRVLNADALLQHQLRGQHVNVVIVDEGLNRNAIPAANWGGGLISVPPPPAPPGSAPRTSHGMLIASNVLNIAPDAILYDVPMIPRRITNVLVFVSDAHVVYKWIEILISFYGNSRSRAGTVRGFLVNAWAIFDRSSELPTLGDYTENNHPHGHPFNNIISTMAQNNIDIVFAAGIAVSFVRTGDAASSIAGPATVSGCECPFWLSWSVRCGPTSCGSAIRRRGRDPACSRRPGQPPPNKKPDFCDPEPVQRTTDAHVESNLHAILPPPHPRTNTGIFDLLRTGRRSCRRLRSNPKWNQVAVTPDALKQRLIETARETKDRTGTNVWGRGP